MKRILFVMSMVLAVAASADAAVFYFTPSQPDLNDLDHRWNKSWGIDWSAYTGETIVGAKLTFENIWDWRVESDILFVNLLDNPALGIVTSWDGADNFNQFAGEGSLIGTWSDPVGGSSQSFDLVFEFDAAQLELLNTYAMDGVFGLGIDPDCHYYNDGVTLEITTRGQDNPPLGTPEPATMALFGLGLAGLGLIRGRKK